MEWKNDRRSALTYSSRRDERSMRKSSRKSTLGRITPRPSICIDALLPRFILVCADVIEFAKCGQHSLMTALISIVAIGPGKLCLSDFSHNRFGD